MKKIAILLISIIFIIIGMGTLYASDSIDVTTSDTFYFYSTDSLAAEDGYYAAVVVDGTPYYLDNFFYMDVVIVYCKYWILECVCFANNYF